jgi:chloramphenicol 3-O phosphotransferase
MASTPADLLPGIGLRPGGERPDLEDFVRRCYRGLFDSFAAFSRHGISGYADLGVLDWYSQPLVSWLEARERQAGLPTPVIGVRSSVDEILERRAADPDGYEVAGGGRIPAAILRWERAVHDPGRYDFEVDTTSHSPSRCAAAILAHLEA